MSNISILLMSTYTHVVAGYVVAGYVGAVRRSDDNDNSY